MDAQSTAYAEQFQYPEYSDQAYQTLADEDQYGGAVGGYSAYPAGSLEELWLGRPEAEPTVQVSATPIIGNLPVRKIQNVSFFIRNKVSNLSFDSGVNQNVWGKTNVSD